MNDDYDSPWKDALQRYFPEFMSFYFPDAFGEIDWSVECLFLEQELAQVVRDAELGLRRVDKLVRVRRVGGQEDWIFIHIDVQGRYDKEFAERIFIYNYRIFDRYRRPVASLAVLGDGSQTWKPNHFRYGVFGCEMGIRFPVIKLNQFAGQVERLLQEDNAFALVTAAHLLTQQTKREPVKRFTAKWSLLRLLYERKWERQRIIDLFNVIDWMMAISPSLQNQLQSNIRELERILAMPYMNSFEKYGREEGQQEGIRQLLVIQLEKRFGQLPPLTVERLSRASKDDLQRWGAALLDAPTIDQVFSSS